MGLNNPNNKKISPTLFGECFCERFVELGFFFYKKIEDATGILFSMINV